jgi:NADH dehydrogenase
MTSTGRRITVFGGSGFVGEHLIRRLAKQGWVVRVAVRDPATALKLKPLGNVGQIVPMRADIRDQAAVDLAVAGAEAVVNLVGILYESGIATFQAIHAEGAGRVAAAAAKAGAQHLVHMSAIGADPASASAYARTKAAGEQAVLAAFPAAVIMRPSIIFGPEDSFFNRFARMAQLSPVLPLIGGGQTRFQPVYVGDVAEAGMRALDDPATAGRTYELGGPRVYTFKELMELVLAETGRHCLLCNLPFRLAEIQAAILERLPGGKMILTRDQVEQLKRDNVVSPGMPGLAELDVAPTPVEAIIPTYLDIYRRGGRFTRRAA